MRAQFGLVGAVVDSAGPNTRYPSERDHQIPVVVLEWRLGAVL
jgi:hypothetical protein